MRALLFFFIVLIILSLIPTPYYKTTTTCIGETNCTKESTFELGPSAFQILKDRYLPTDSPDKSE